MAPNLPDAKPHGPCYWCWRLQPDHTPEQCSERKDKPEMPEYKRDRVVRTRSKGPATSGRGKPSGRTKAEQQAHEATYKQVYMQRQRNLVKAAKEKFAEHRARVDAPIMAHGPMGQYI